MRLVVFDLDGTLAATLAVDHRCFIEAFALEHGIEFLDDDWSHYSQTTDSGITPEVIARAFGRPATAAEVDGHKRRFIALLEAAAAAEPQAFAAVAGAGELLAALAADPGWEAVVATGSWRESALLKLRLAGLDGFELPLATADDARSREEIVAHGVALADGGGPFEGVVLVGDKPWDLGAARHHGFGFVGVGAGKARERLAAAGAEHLFEDWRQTGRVLAAMESVALGAPVGRTG